MTDLLKKKCCLFHVDSPALISETTAARGCEHWLGIPQIGRGSGGQAGQAPANLVEHCLPYPLRQAAFALR
ncbi:hypothetical protein PoB_000208000 [Plakobranchus ocellatus]|uniref:Uncharacterized protein n=1 Tax=Plakobranchus ocellatus TaxID=259542 RepID=A0AAV3XXQ1_9GAST|nr:hypothetical protein PoB_000208000 [Plakobranchus ocellatus]